MDIKFWLEKTGLKVREGYFLKPPSLPYIVFSDDVQAGGADDKIFTQSHNVTINLYSQTIDKAAQAKVELLLNEKAYKYTRINIFIASEKFIQTTYTFKFTEII